TALLLLPAIIRTTGAEVNQSCPTTKAQRARQFTKGAGRKCVASSPGKRDNLAGETEGRDVLCGRKAQMPMGGSPGDGKH
ncbi:MAG: hypothetical protein ACOC8E_08080, partial [Planctomycetota bacterium]